jgi:GMP synthase-like glutamine amidotransferase
MKTLVVNCNLNGNPSEQLVIVVEKFSDAKVVNFRDIGCSYQIDGEIDSVVISGSMAHIVNPAHQIMFQNIAELIRNCDLPLLGICFGHQLLCHTLGAKVGSLPKGRFEGFENVRVLDADGLFDGFLAGSTVPLAENHYDYVLKDGLDQAGFTLLANSASCEVEAVKHKAKPFYGVQFHPERITYKNETHPEGHKIIENFFKKVVKR